MHLRLSDWLIGFWAIIELRYKVDRSDFACGAIRTSDDTRWKTEEETRNMGKELNVKDFNFKLANIKQVESHRSSSTHSMPFSSALSKPNWLYIWLVAS